MQRAGWIEVLKQRPADADAWRLAANAIGSGARTASRETIVDWLDALSRISVDEASPASAARDVLVSLLGGLREVDVQADADATLERVLSTAPGSWKTAALLAARSGNAVRPQDVVAATGKDKGQVSRELMAMVRHGFLDAPTRLPHDGRQRQYRLRPLGERLAAIAEAEEERRAEDRQRAEATAARERLRELQECVSNARAAESLYGKIVESVRAAEQTADEFLQPPLLLRLEEFTVHEPAALMSLGSAVEVWRKIASLHKRLEQKLTDANVYATQAHGLVRTSARTIDNLVTLDGAFEGPNPEHPGKLQALPYGSPPVVPQSVIQAHVAPQYPNATMIARPPTSADTEADAE